MKNMSILLIILLNIMIIQTISSADYPDNDEVYRQMSVQDVEKRRKILVQQNIQKELDWTKEKQVETWCGVCCCFFAPIALCSYIGYHLNNDIGLPIGTLIGSKISSETVSAFANWYQPDYGDSITELKIIQRILVEKQKEKTD